MRDSGSLIRSVEAAIRIVFGFLSSYCTSWRVCLSKVLMEKKFLQEISRNS